MFKDVFDQELQQFDSFVDQECFRLLSNHSLRVAVVEGLTGGLLAHRLMYQPGSSSYFMGGIICYDNLLKINLCGVSPKTIRTYGPASQEVVSEMLTGVKRIIPADIYLGIVGIAGPPDSQFTSTQIGKICFGVHKDNRTYIKEMMLPGNRSEILSRATSSVIGFLNQLLKQSDS